MSMLMSSNLTPDDQERVVGGSSLAQLAAGLWWSKQSLQSAVQETNAVEWQLLLHKSNCIRSKKMWFVLLILSQKQKRKWREMMVSAAVG